MLLSCVNKFLLDLEDDIFSLRKNNFDDYVLFDLMNKKKIVFCDGFAQETGTNDLSYSIEVCNFLIMLYRFKRKLPTYFACFLEDFLRLDLTKQQIVLDFIKKVYDQLIQYTAMDYQKRYGKQHLQPKELVAALQEWMGEY